MEEREKNISELKKRNKKTTKEKVKNQERKKDIVREKLLKWKADDNRQKKMKTRLILR